MVGVGLGGSDCWFWGWGWGDGLQFSFFSSFGCSHSSHTNASLTPPPSFLLPYPIFSPFLPPPLRASESLDSSPPGGCVTLTLASLNLGFVISPPGLALILTELLILPSPCVERSDEWKVVNYVRRRCNALLSLRSIHRSSIRSSLPPHFALRPPRCLRNPNPPLNDLFGCLIPPW